MRNATAVSMVFVGGFAIMVLEIVGARFLTKDFGSSIYVWVSQIGVILIALAMGYYVGGSLADRFQKLAFLACLMIPAGIMTALVPNFADPLIDRIINRHPPPPAPIPPLWQKLDPALGSVLIFMLPCFALATTCPYMIRLSARHLAHVGRISGLMFAASTIGSIAGVFISGYYLIDHFRMSSIFRGTGALMVLLGILCVSVSRWFATGRAEENT